MIITMERASVWKWLFGLETVLLGIAVYLYFDKAAQLRNQSRPLIVQTNVIVTNVTTTVEVTTNVVVKNEVVTNVIRTNIAAPAKPIHFTPGPKVQLRGYNLVPVNRMVYAHAVVQNITTNTLKQVRIRFTEYGWSRRGLVRIGSLADSINNLGPYQFWELRKPADRRAIQLELVDLSASE